jgi:hypothetical protein
VGGGVGDGTIHKPLTEKVEMIILPEIHVKLQVGRTGGGLLHLLEPVIYNVTEGLIR